MSSFQKRDNSKHKMVGTKIKNNHLYVSSGIPSLDFVVGGGLPVGAIFAAEEDILGTYGKVLLKYFIAEGVVCKHDIFVASADENPGNIVKESPQHCTTIVEDDITSMSSDMDKMKIAWRYEGLGQVESSFGNNTNFGHKFDLSKPLDQNTIADSKIKYWSLASYETIVEPNKGSMYSDLLLAIRRLLSKGKYHQHNPSRGILRLAIQSIGSPVWMAKECDEGRCNNGSGLMRFMYLLKEVISKHNVVAYVTVPSHYIREKSIVKRIIYTVDNAVRLESFVDTYRRTNPVYKDYHGLFHVTKLSSPNSMAHFIPPSKDIAFKLKRKKFIIEKLHLPPELQETKEREQDDITATPKPSLGCGGFRPSNIDF